MIRRLLFWVLVIIFIWVVITQFDEIKMFARTLSQGRPGWILLAIILVIIYNIIFAVSFQMSYAAVDIHLRLSEMASVMMASLFVDTVAPGGSATSMALFLDDAVRRGYSATRAAVGLLIQTIADFTSLTLVMSPGLIYLVARGEADINAVLGVGSILIMTVGLLGVVMLGLWRPALLQRLFKFFQRLVNAPAVWLKRPNFLEDNWAEENAVELIDAASAIAHHPKQLFTITLIMLTVNVIEVAALKVVFLSFGYDIGLEALIAGFSLMTLASIISPVPQGIGIMEGAMVYVFNLMGVPWDINLTTSLTYRGLSFWLPMIAGFLLLRRVRTFQA